LVTPSDEAPHQSNRFHLTVQILCETANNN
jgi:hypothetical protein